MVFGLLPSPSSHAAQSVSVSPTLYFFCFLLQLLELAMLSKDERVFPLELVMATPELASQKGHVARTPFPRNQTYFLMLPILPAFMNGTSSGNGGGHSHSLPVKAEINIFLVLHHMVPCC